MLILVTGLEAGGLTDDPTLVYRSLSGMAPAYLAAECQPLSKEGRRQLHSARVVLWAIVQGVYNSWKSWKSPGV